jgi:hypothetical protein
VTPVVNEKEKKKKKEVLSPRQFSMVVKFLLVDGGRVADVGADIETDVEGEVSAILLPLSLSFPASLTSLPFSGTQVLESLHSGPMIGLKYRPIPPVRLHSSGAQLRG